MLRPFITSGKQQLKTKTISQNPGALVTIDGIDSSSLQNVHIVLTYPLIGKPPSHKLSQV